MRWRNAVSLHHISLPHGLNMLGLGCRLKSTSGREPSPLPHTREATPIKSKVAPQLTASQVVDYYSTAHSVDLSPPGGGLPPHGSPYERRYPVRRNHRSGPATHVQEITAIL